MEGLVSICVPAYNAEEFIGATLESALAQTYAPIEVIVCDNDSTDSTGMIADGYAKSDRRVRYFRNAENIGMVRNWNEAASHASGEYIKILCADDLLAPDCVERQVAALREHPSCSIVTNNVVIIDSRSREIGRRKNAHRTRVYPGREYARKSMLSKNLVGEPSSVLMKKELFEAEGGFDQRFKYLPDWDLWLRAMQRGDVAYLSACLSSYRVARTSMTSELSRSGDEALYEDDRLLLEKHGARGALRLSPAEELLHKTAFRFRNVSRGLFYALFVR